tara:strand:+ start:51049 stop:52698 length:1650 start_codon:yes stop_codon:yes gene_type:complete
MFLGYLICQIPSERLYITIQMQDQIGIINTETNEIDMLIATEMQNSQNMDCMDYQDSAMCDMMDGCEWMMGMCMETSDLDCMEYEDSMDCEMAGCMWMDDHCMESNDNCMDYEDSTMCDMMEGCEWMMGMCMETSVSDCMDYENSMDCEMAGCMWMMDMCMDNMNDNDVNTPHFIVMDEQLGYWFTTTIASGYIAQYSLIDNTLIDSYFIGDAPAILAIDTEMQRIYSSRMMPMNGMGDMMPSSNSQIIHSLNYSPMGLTASGISEYEIASPAPHGLAINEDGTEVYTASNTADWLYKINVHDNLVEGVSMDPSIGNPQDQVTQRLKPIQCLSVGNKLFVSCSAGTWYNPFTGESSVLPGELQMWDSDSMLLIDSIELGDYSGPWHIKESPVDDIVYVALSGDNLYETEGLAAIRFNNNNLQLEWVTTDPSFDTLHGVDVSHDGENIYVSGRGDGSIHIFNNTGEYIDAIYTGGMSMLGGICITKKDVPAIGDSNNNGSIDIVDVVAVINFIIDDIMMSPYQMYANDTNIDGFVDVVDVIAIINNILDS